ncbi:MAG: Cd2+/Zn2+-exporting ATPase, partial [Rhodoferax sp.]
MNLFLKLVMSTQHKHHSHDHDHPHAHAVESCCSTVGDEHADHRVSPTLGNAVLTGAGTPTPIRIMQMDCPTEEALLRKKLGSMEGLTGMEFNLMQRVLTVTHDPQILEPILAAIRSLGFTPEIASATPAPTDPTPEPAKPWWPL